MSDLSSRRASRRTMLKALGLGAVLAPFFGMERKSRAGGASNPLNFVVFTWSNGINGPDVFFPAAGTFSSLASNFTPPPVTAPVFDPAYANVRDHVLIPNGLHNAAGEGNGFGNDGHNGFLTLLSGRSPIFNAGHSARSAGGATIDQAIAQGIAMVGPSVAFPSLNIGTITGINNNPAMFPSWSGIDSPNVPVEHPATLFSTLFGDSTNQQMLTQQRLRSQSVLDSVAGDLSAFTNELGTVDGAKVAQHLQNVRELETGIADLLAAGVCSTSLVSSTTPLAPETGLLWDSAMPLVSALQQKILVQALACGLTKVATVQYGNAAGDNLSITPTNGLGINTNGTSLNTHYDLAHGGFGATLQGGARNPDFDFKNQFDAWHVTQFMKFLSMLKDNQLLDSTVVMLVNNMAGAGGYHAESSVPVLLSAPPSVMKTGQSVDYSGLTGSNAKTMNQLCATVANAVGVPMTSFGDTTYGQGQLGDLLV